MLIDHFLPTADFSEHHRIRIAAPPAQVLAAALAYSPSEDRFFRMAIALREWPMHLLAWYRGRPAPLSQPFGMDNFTLLGKSAEEVVYGMAGRFWQSDYGQSTIVDGEAFRDYNQEGSARLALRFTVSTSSDGRTQLETETRIQCLGAAALRRFRCYWIVIRPVSGIIRRRMLTHLRRQLERG